MFLYNITLQRATGITHAIHGNFSGELTHDAFNVSIVNNCKVWVYKLMLSYCMQCLIS